MQCETCEKVRALQVALDMANEKLKYVCGEDAPQYDCEAGRDTLNGWIESWKYELEHKNDITRCGECEYAANRDGINIWCTQFYGTFGQNSYCSYGRRVRDEKTYTSKDA